MPTLSDPRDTTEFTVSVAGPSPSVGVEVAARSHTGLVRPNNEDVYLIVHYGRFWRTVATNLPEGEAPKRIDTDGHGLLVADGVGGHAAGEVASRLAVTELIRYALDIPDWILAPGAEDWSRIVERAREAYDRMDAALRAEVEARPEFSGMGTTMTIARNLGRDLLVAHVGDSRAYLLRGDDFRQLTRDHTLAQELADARGISPADVVKHVFRHVLTRAVGGKVGWTGVDINKFGLNDGDQVLLCSDGLTDMVTPAAIATILRDAATAEAACEQLVDAALHNGGKDNVTVVLGRYRLANAGASI
jgi:protein phosphatase